MNPVLSHIGVYDMKEAEKEYSKYATAFYEVIEGGKGGKAKFVKMLLKMGLSRNGKNIINEEFPTETTSKGNTIIEKKASDRLRKYLLGKNDISEIADEIYAALDHENYGDYIEALGDYEDSLLIEFAKRLELDTDSKDINKVRYDIAAYYYSIIEKASRQKSSEPNKTNGTTDLILSYTITGSEKVALTKLCDLIKRTLVDLKHQADRIDKMQFELKSLTESDEDKNWKPHLEYDRDSRIIRFDETYSRFENLRANLIELLTPKKNMDISFDSFVSNTSDSIRKEYKITYPCSFNYKSIVSMISEFNSSIDRIIRYTSKL